MRIDIFHTEKKYEIIYADPPWEYKQSGSKEQAREWQSSITRPCAQKRYAGCQ